MDTAVRRLAAQGLIDSELDDASGVVGRLLAVQAQDPRGARLAIRPRRSRPGSAAEIDAGLNDGSLVIGWLNRGTLHLVRSEDYRWLHSLTSKRQMTSNRTRLRQEGVSENQAERGVELVVDRLADGPATRGEIRGLLENQGIPVAGQALVHILFFASLRGLILRGPMKAGEHAFVLVDDWLDSEPESQHEVALAELARRYLAGHGPASERDLAKWAGVTLGQARKGLELIGDELIEVETESGATVDLKRRPEPDGGVPARLLGAFDPILHGWESRDWLIPDRDGRKVVTTNGIFRPTILVENRIVGTWTMPGGKVELAPFAELDRKARATLSEEAEAVVRYLAD